MVINWNVILLNAHILICKHALLLHNSLIPNLPAMQGRTREFYTFSIQIPMSEILWSKRAFPASMHAMLSKVLDGNFSLLAQSLIIFTFSS